MNLFFKFINYFKKDTLFFIFLFTLLISWTTHISFRNDHFQEGDSSGTYSFLHDFPTATLRATALSYPKDNFLSLDQAQRILQNKTVQSIRSKYLKDFSDDFIIEQLTKSSALATFRYALIQGVNTLNMPFPIQSFFAMGLGSTYSSGVGFLYGLVGGEGGSYEDFMSRNMVISITLFHFATLLLFLILRKLGSTDLISVLISLLALFSISLYSSGIHIGSTVWNFTTELFWLWYLIRNINSTNLSKKISWLSGILVFFNYLILFLWIAFIIITIKNRIIRFSFKELLGNAVILIKEQKFAITMIGLCGILFFQPGQGFRGLTLLAELPKNTYYIVLNFFSWYTNSSLINIIQFILGGILILIGGFYILQKQETKEKETLRNVIRIFSAIFVILVFNKTLSFTPTRHILFLFPFIFLASGMGLNYLAGKTKKTIPKYFQIIFILSMVVIGLTTIKIRHFYSLDLSKKIQIDEDVSMIGIYDSSYNILYPNLQSGIPVNFINPKNFKVGEVHLYASQSEPFDVAFKEWLEKYDIVVQKIWEKNEITEAYFTAYNPDFKNSRYSRPNNFFQTKFKIISISKK